MTLNDIISAFKENERILNEANKLDETDFKFNFNKAIDILNKFRKFNAKFVSKKALVITNGNPYVTLIIIMQAISQNIQLDINIQNRLPILNSAIIKIFETNICDFNIKLHIDMSPREIVDFETDEIIVVDDKAVYDKLYNFGIMPKFISLLNIDLYTDSDKLSDLTSTIYDYCNQKFIGINLHKNEKIENFVYNEDRERSGNISLILTEKPIDKKLVEEKLHNKLVYINCNPFKTLESDVALKRIL